MNAKEARGTIKFCGDICFHLDCKVAKGFLEATKAAEPLLKIGNLLHDFCQVNHSQGETCEWTEAVEKYRSETLGQEK